MVELNLTGQMCTVFFNIVILADYDNKFTIPQKELSEKLKIPKAQLSRCIKTLVKKGLIFNDGKIKKTKIFRINTKYFYKGYLNLSQNNDNNIYNINKNKIGVI
jgi:DNA-binding IclR family transcriptional regulator